LHIHYALVGGNLGRTLIAQTGRGVCSILVGEDDKMLVEDLRREFPESVLARKQALSGQCIATLNSCQEENRLLSELSLELRRRIFQARALKALL
jgi:AraC family transcriptional regulator of adaptative response/methylated-DNA-[protein]-cysteine methyltransferase